MKNKIEAMERVLKHHIRGFHQYVLDAPAHLSFVSQSFCELLGLTEDELLSDEQDCYFSRVVSDDRRSYADFLHKLSEKEQTLTLQYRILGGDGGIHAVSDTMVSERTEQGILVGSSILTDITTLKIEDSSLVQLTSLDHRNDASYGILRFTCEKHPKVTYINDYMLDILRFPKVGDGEVDDLELYKKNIYLMIPMEERRRFSRFLDQVYHSNKPMVGGMTVLRYDGAKTRLFGWISRCVDSQGAEEFQCICIESSERYYEKRSKEINRYLTVLSGVCHMVSVYDFSNETVQYFYGETSGVLGQPESIPMQMETATEKWIRDSVAEEDGERVRDYFQRYFQERRASEESESLPIKYSAFDSDGAVKVYTGIFLKIDTFVDLFCSRCMPDESEVSMLRNENDSLKNLVMNFSDGMTAKIQEQPRTRSGKKVYIRTFGYFDVFVDGAPIAFRSQKAKELFALLVDRKGGFVSSEEAIGFLWEDEPLSSVVFARYRKIALRLKNILEEYDILDIIEVSDGKRRLIVEKTGCDYYDYLSGKEEYATLFKGSYLMNYSWGERTLGELMSE